MIKLTCNLCEREIENRVAIYGFSFYDKDNIDIAVKSLINYKKHICIDCIRAITKRFDYVVSEEQSDFVKPNF
jgi:hypothetical protein